MTDPTRHVIEHLSVYLDNLLPENERFMVENHLKECSSCERQHQELMHLRKALRDQPVLTPPEGFYQAVFKRLDAKRAGSSAWWRGIPTKTLVSATAVMIVVLGSMKLVIDKNTGTTHVPAHLPGHEPISKMLETPPAQDVTRIPPPIPPASAMAAAEAKSNEALKEADVVDVLPAPPPPATESAKPVVVKAKGSSSFAAGAAHLSKDRSSTLQALKPIPASVPVAVPVAVPTRRTVLDEAYPTEAKKGLDVNLPLRAEKMAPKTMLEWRGTESGLRKYRTYILRNSDEWQKAWEGIGSGDPLPDIDFNQFMVVGIATGQTHQRGQGLELMGTRVTSDAMVIYYRDAVDMFRKTPTASAYTPYHFKVVPKSTLPVEFQKI